MGPAASPGLVGASRGGYVTEPRQQPSSRGERPSPLPEINYSAPRVPHFQGFVARWKRPILIYMRAGSSQPRSPTRRVGDVMLNEAFASAEDAVVFVCNVLDSSTEYSLVATDPDGVIVLWNEGARRLYGYELAEMIGKHWGVLHAEEAVDGLPEEMTRRAIDVGSWTGILAGIRKDASAFTTRVVMTPRWGTDGTLDGFLLISSDITAQVRAQRQLERAQAYNRSLIDSAPDAMVIVNERGAIELANAATERMFGYGREKLIGRSVEMLIPERYRDGHSEQRAAFFRAPRSRAMDSGLELWGLRSDGHEFPVEISLSPLQTEDALLVTAAIRDVSERKR